MANETKNNVINTLEDFFKKAPALPAEWKEFVVKVTPWVALIGGIAGILFLLPILGLATVISPLAMFGGVSGTMSYGGGILGGWISLVAMVILVAAFPGTKARKMSGWNLLFWSDVVFIVGSLVGGDILGAVVKGLIAFYLLFQIKSYYK